MLKRYNKVIYIGILVIFFVSIIFSAIPAISHCGTWLTPPFALFTGLIFALFCGKPFATFNKKMSKTLLQYSVVGLGFGMNIHESIASGSKGMFFTIVSVFGTLVLGWLIGRRFLKIEKNISYLISSGTAICGGSAIAAVAPIVKAKESEISIALGTVFILNAI
ncbi:MAG: putative sulfate exporter family transporter, partial [Bacteroidaceae bacterium]|nr:putative sulfate exporter family transporter [Bacteroidaceae bacterium]